MSGAIRSVKKRVKKSGIADALTMAGGDPLRISGSDKDDPAYSGAMKILGKAGGERGAKKLGNLFSHLAQRVGDVKRATVLDAMKAAREQEEALKTYDAGPVPNAVESMQQGIGQRLTGMRAGRDEAVARRAQPGLQNIASTAGLKQRQLAQGPMGSLSMAERGGIMTDKALGNQAVQAEALGQQLNTEQGLQQLETEFTSFFNELAANRFSRELSGLSEQMNEYLSAQGAKIGYEQLAAEARRSTMEMYGRFASGIGRELQKKDKPEKK